ALARSSDGEHLNPVVVNEEAGPAGRKVVAGSQPYPPHEPLLSPRDRRYIMANRGSGLREGERIPSLLILTTARPLTSKSRSPHPSGFRDPTPTMDRPPGSRA